MQEVGHKEPIPADWSMAPSTRVRRRLHPHNGFSLPNLTHCSLLPPWAASAWQRSNRTPLLDSRRNQARPADSRPPTTWLVHSDTEDGAIVALRGSLIFLEWEPDSGLLIEPYIRVDEISGKKTRNQGPSLEILKALH